jgi:N-acetylmuramoyl-L-alanine amidase
MGVANSLKSCVFAFFSVVSLSVYAQSSTFKVTLDAGHGGKDFGAVYYGHIEKNIALAVTLKVGKILENTPGIQVIYTRKSDVFIELNERANIANRADSHIFVSVHCNANKNTAAYGTETYVMGMSKNASNLEAAKKENAVITMEKDYQQKYEGFDPKSPESMIGLTLMQEEYLENSIALASKIQDIFTDALGKKSRGVKQAPFWVLHKAYMPRVLIEMGFISNPADGAYLDSEEGQNETAKAIADAIIGYKKEYFGSGGEIAVTERPSQKIVEPVIKPSREEVVVVEKPVVKPVTTPVVNKEPETSSVVAGVIFKVQLAVSSSKLDLTPENFNGLSPLSMQTANSLYKYMYGETSDYNQARKLMQEARSKGYGEAFVIAFRDGKKITVQEALK